VVGVEIILHTSCARAQRPLSKRLDAGFAACLPARTMITPALPGSSCDTRWPSRHTRPMNRQRLKDLLAEYGRLALYTYLVLFVIVLVGFAGAIHWGVRVESTAGKAGLWGAAWLATKVTQPLRILATVALTPLVAQVLKRRKKTAPVDGTVLRTKTF